MFYSFNVTVTHGTTEATLEETLMKLSAGVIHQIDIIFPYNSNRELYVRILHEAYSIIPTNRTSAIRAHNTLISTREFYDLSAAENVLTVQAWNVHATDDFLISINIGILPRRIIQPFSFQELMAAALGMED